MSNQRKIDFEYVVTDNREKQVKLEFSAATGHLVRMTVYKSRNDPISDSLETVSECLMRRGLTDAPLQ